MKFFALLGFLICDFANTASALSPTVQITESPAFDTVEQAAVAALVPITTVFAEEEYGGAVILRGSKFFYTSPVSAGHNNRTSYQILLAKGDKVAGLYHTHPLSRLNYFAAQGQEAVANWFSGADVEAARRLSVPSYIGVESSHSIRLFDPAASANRHVPKYGSALGVLVRALPDSTDKALSASILVQ